MEITKDIVYLGVNDHAVDLFESQYSVPNGMAYNSYLIMDDQTVVMDTVDAHFTDEWITKIAAALGDRAPDYLVVQHMEPDHAGSIDAFAQAYPTTKIVSSAKAFVMMQQFFGTDYADRRIVVKEGDTLPLGHHTLHFVTAPMVHWPEVIMTYDDADKVLFSADAFGKFGALDVEEEWLPEARRYFIGIVGKYGVQVQAVLKKAAGLDIETICSLHGPILHKEQLADVLAAYDTWSAYRPETDGILVAYTSIYGHTADAAHQGPAGRCDGPGPLRYGRGRRPGIPLQQAGAGNPHLQRRRLPVHQDLHRASDRAQLPEPYRRPDGEWFLGTHRCPRHAQDVRGKQEPDHPGRDRHRQGLAG